MLESINGEMSEGVIISKDIDRDVRNKDDHMLVELND